MAWTAEAQTLFFLKSPATPLVKPSTAPDFCCCMAAKSIDTPSTITPCFLNPDFASAYKWLDCKRACRIHTQQPCLQAGFGKTVAGHTRADPA